MRVARVRPSTLAAWALLALTALATAGLRRLDTHPWLLPPRWAAPDPALPAPRPKLEAAVVLDRPVITTAAAKGHYPSRDSSAAWWNWLTQEVGPAAILSPAALKPAHLERIRLLVITRSVAESPGPAQLEAVRSLVAGGAAVVLELPPAGWEPLTGLTLSGPERTGGRLTRTAFAMPPAAQAVLSSLDLPVRSRTSSLQDPGLTPLLWLDDTPVAFARRFDRGVVVTLAIDLGHLLQSLQQGRPDEDMRVRNRYLDRKQAEVLETNDLVAAPELLTAEVPVADLLEDGLFRYLASEVGLPAWWLYPEAAPGAFLMSHDEEGIGGKAAWMAEAEAAWQCPSTNFLVPSPALSSGDIARYARAKAAVALHYVLPGPNGEDYPGSGFDLEGRFQTFGLWKIHPVRRLLSPAEQWAWLQQRADDVPVTRATRTHFLAWTDDYTGIFHGLAEAGIGIDSSYGPDLHNRGFLFGTARPFRPLGPDGLPLPVLELPFISAEDLGGADRAFLFRMLEESAAQTHQALSVLYHPNSFAWHPSAANYLTWKAICQKARALGHWVTTFDALEAFQKRRESGTLHSEATGTGLRITYAFEGGGGTLVLPSSWRDLRLTQVVDDSGQPLEVLEPAGSGVRLVRLPADHGVLEARYEAPSLSPSASDR